MIEEGKDKLEWTRQVSNLNDHDGEGESFKLLVEEDGNHDEDMFARSLNSIHQGGPCKAEHPEGADRGAGLQGEHAEDHQDHLRVCLHDLCWWVSNKL